MKHWSYSLLLIVFLLGIQKANGQRIRRPLAIEDTLKMVITDDDVIIVHDNLPDSLHLFFKPENIEIKRRNSYYFFPTKFEDTVNLIYHKDNGVVLETVEPPTDTSRNWKFGADFRLTLKQVRFDNWNDGGNGIFSIGSGLSVTADRKGEDYLIENRFESAIGVFKEDNELNDDWKKNNDRLRAISRFNRYIGKSREFFLSGKFDFRTQYAVGYKYSVVGSDSSRREVATLSSQFMAPGYLEPSLGVRYNNKGLIDLTLSPITGKFTFVLDDTLSANGAFGVHPGRKGRVESGSGLTMISKLRLLQNITFKTELNLFSNFETFIDEIDVNWEGELEFKVNKYITSSWQARMIYDQDIDIQRDAGPYKGTTGPAIQFRNEINLTFHVQL